MAILIETYFRDQFSNLVNSIVLFFFKYSKQYSVVKYNLDNGLMDTFIDESGVDTTASTFELYNAEGDYYSVDTPLSNNMTLISLSTTATSTPIKGRIIIFEEDVDFITLNTDLKAYVSRDGGTTYTQLTLIDKGFYSGTTKRILVSEVTDISAQPAGTSMKWKVTTHNNKDLKLHGISLNWEFIGD
jgi:hypothetical protein